MNATKLRAAMVLNQKTPETLAESIGMHLNTMYSRLRGESEFKQSEISAIAHVLQLTDQGIIAIFFDDDVSEKTQEGI